MPDWFAIGMLALGLVIWLDLRGVKGRVDLAVRRLERLASLAERLPTEQQVAVLEAGVMQGLDGIKEEVTDVSREIYASRMDVSQIAEKLPTQPQISMFEESVARDLHSIQQEIVQVGREIYESRADR